MAITPQHEKIQKKPQKEIVDFPQEIEMTSHHTFNPAHIKIKTGTSVRWSNYSKETHTVTLDPRLAQNSRNCLLPKKAETFDSGPLKPGEKFEHNFTVQGRYRYFCKVHETMGMTGEIVVED